MATGVTRQSINSARKNSTGNIFRRSRLNLIEGTNVTLTVADDPTNGEIDVTIAASGGGGGGTVTDVSVVTANGISGSVATSTTTPAITLTLGDINPSKINVGTPDPMTVHGAAVTAQIQNNSDTQAIQESHTHSATATSAAIYYGARSRGTTASPTIVQSGDYIRIDSAVGYDGVDYEAVGYTAWLVGGTPGSNDMPGKYVIAVTPDGGFTPVEAVNISSTGVATFAQTISGSITGNAATVTTNANLTGPITSVGNATSVASQTGTGSKFVMDTSPTLVTPVLGVAAATSINKVAITAPATSATLTIADGKTLTVNASTTLATDSITFAGTEVLTLAAAKNVTFADAFATSGAFSTTVTSTATTTVTLPASGILANIAIAQVVSMNYVNTFITALS